MFYIISKDFIVLFAIENVSFSPKWPLPLWKTVDFISVISLTNDNLRSIPILAGYLLYVLCLIEEKTNISRANCQTNGDMIILTGSQTYLLLTIEHSETEPEPVKW